MNNKIQQLLYANNKINKQRPVKITASEKNIAIVIHIFYVDIWQEIIQYLNQLDMAYDLYITIPQSMPDSDIINIFKDKADATIYMTENRGRDVLPFLQVMNVIGRENYKYICKMHTKKTGDSALGNVWRKLLYFDLIGSNKTVNDIVNLFENDENIGTITGKNTILDSQRYTYGNTEKIDLLAGKLGMVYDEYYLFPAGTMFWTRSEIVAPIAKLLADNQLDFEEEAGQKDDTLAHAIERFFGIICQVKKKEIIESPAHYSQIGNQTLNEVASLVLSQQYVGADVFSMQKQKIQARDERILELEALAESMRIKNRLKNILSDKIIPLGGKIAKIPKKVIGILKVIKNNPSILKKVFYYAKKGELKYLLTKIKEKSRNNLAESNNLIEVSPAQYFTTFNKEKYTLGNMTVDIIIPVYNGYEFLEKLFNSVEKNTTSEYRLIVINDCSPDERVKSYLLERLKKHPSAIFIDHKENQGFLKSVNEAYTYVSDHFLLLNTDTEVPAFWMERLMYPIIHMDKVASTTPFTNSGEIASFPNFVADNEIFDGMEVNDLDKAFREVNPQDFYAEVPTGVGFCMGVNYTLTKDIGMFVEDTFGKGYGEENDWCQRAIQKGYRNFIVPNLFVYHKHGGSFSAEEKQALLKVNAVKLLDRHPNYGKDVTAYIEENPHATLRQLLVLMAANAQVGTHLIFDHALGGGANIYADELREKYVEEGKNVLLVQYDFYSHCYTLTHTYKTYNFNFKITEFEALKTFIQKLKLEELFINNIVSYKTPQQLLTYFHKLVEDKSITLAIPIHDMYVLCPSYNLLNEKGQYCNMPDIEICKLCMTTNMQEWRNFYPEPVDIVEWRASWTKLLNRSNKVLCFSNNSKEVFVKAYPEVDIKKINIIPHQVKDIAPLVLKKDPNKTTTTIGILGAINYVKGSSIIKQMIQLIERDNLDINIVVIGEITEPIKSKHFHSTGRYKRDDLPSIIQEHDIDIFIIPSIWPETFSYTTQEIMMMELPLMVFNLGAPAERVSKYGKGYIIDEISANAALKTLTKLNL